MLRTPSLHRRAELRPVAFTFAAPIVPIEGSARHEVQSCRLAEMSSDRRLGNADRFSTYVQRTE